MNKYEKHLLETKQGPWKVLAFFQKLVERRLSHDDLTHYYEKLGEFNDFRNETKHPPDSHAYRSRELWDRYADITEKEINEGLPHELQNTRFQFAIHRADLIYARLLAPEQGILSMHDHCFWCEHMTKHVDTCKRWQRQKQKRIAEIQ